MLHYLDNSSIKLIQLSVISAQRAKCIVLLFCTLAILNAKAQGPTANKPEIGVTQVSPTSVPVYIPSAFSQGIPLNYLKTQTAKGAIQDEAAFASASYIDVAEATQYVDGLGRPLQTVSRQVSPGSSPQDMVTPVVYDAYGREPANFMSYLSASSDGRFRYDVYNEHRNFLQSQYPGEQVFYSKTMFEPSPLNRIIKNFAQGNSWAGSEGTSGEHGVQIKYLANVVNDHVRIWSVSTSSIAFDNTDEATTNIPSTALEYDAGTLSKNVSLDEHGNAVVEYKDLSGLVVLKKVQIGNIAADYSGYDGFLSTYYVYDDYGLLRFAIQPKAVPQLISNGWQLTAVLVNELCFRYEYDERERMVGKKVPGSGWTYMLYDKRDRLVFSQDANMRINGRWLATIYDIYNRPVVTGMLSYGGTRNQLKSSVESSDMSSVGSIGVGGNNPALLPANLTLNTQQSGLQQASTSITMDVGFSTTADFTAELVYTAAGSSFTDGVPISGNPLPSGYAFVPLTVTNYDSYAWTSSIYTTQYNAKLQAVNNTHVVAMPGQADVQTRGLVTGIKTRILENPSNLSQGNWLTTVNFYDDRSHLIQTQSVNYKGGLDILTNLYDFTGKVLSNILTTQNTAASSDISILTKNEFDASARLLSITKSVFQHSSDVNPTSTTTVVKMEYNALGQLISKKLGQTKDDNGNYSSTPLETLDYTYNVRGWMQGINKDYANNSGVHSNDRYFGIELNYDWGFNGKQYNGNIGGTKWRSKGDGEQRAYGYSYDKTNRLLGGDFSQYSGGAYIDNVNNLNFDMQMGNGVDPTTAYDENGNIRVMKQWGWIAGGSALIDDLSYSYDNNGNRLIGMNDASMVVAKLGDYKHSNWQTSFHASNASFTNDYYYDANGNMIKDKQKGIYAFDGEHVWAGVTYNHLNLPYSIPLTHDFNNGIGSGTITYIYDAAGNKLEKRVQDGFVTGGSPKNSVTDYIAGVVYELNQLQFISHEEGRIRPVTATNGTVSYVFDYMIKDHLGNVRALLTDEQRQDKYPAATMESATAPIEKLYYSKIDGNIRQLRNEITNYPSDNTTSINEYVAKVNGSGNKIGPGITLKVMAGDKFSVRATSWWQSNNHESDPTADPLTDLLTLLNPALGGMPGSHATSSELISSSALSPSIVSFLQTKHSGNSPSKPKAYVNWVLFDERFNFVGESSNASPVGESQEFKLHAFTDLPITKSGYLYVYVSNETQNIDVFFDNLQVTHTRGPLLEETQYYPFGLQISGVSSKALGFGGSENMYKYNGKELQTKEFSDGSGLETYDFGARNYDPQIGRWFNIDPLSDLSRRWSPYTFVYNSPLVFTDPDGMFGDYYKKDGTYLGNDGINDDKLYAVENDGVKSSTTTKEGNIVNILDKKKITDVTAETGITHSDFVKLAAVVYGETDQQSGSREEKFAIASASVNNYLARSEDPRSKGLTFSQVLSKISNATFDGNERYGEFNSSSKHDRSQNSEMRDANAAALNAVTLGRDYSNGATGWDGTDLPINAHRHGMNISDPSHDIFKIGDSPLQNGTYVRQSTAAYGRSMFYRIHPSTVKKGTPNY